MGHKIFPGNSATTALSHGLAPSLAAFRSSLLALRRFPFALALEGGLALVLALALTGRPFSEQAERCVVGVIWVDFRACRLGGGCDW
jgi:hypothetical protein